MKTKRNEVLVKVRHAIRHPVDFGYPEYVVLSDGLYICPVCARKEYRDISRDTRNDPASDWAATGTEVYYEGPTLDCVHCGKPVITSAYPEST